jgi:predicted DNA-binding transcriptional regulator AlpA
MENSISRPSANFGALQVLFTFSVLANYVAMGRSRIYALIVDDKFPSPIKIGRSSRWLKSEIDSWITEQATARQSAQAGA